MASNYVAAGKNKSVTAPKNLESGEPFLYGAQLLVAHDDAEAGDTVVAARTGVFKGLPATGASAFEDEERLYWDEGEGELTDDSSNNTRPLVATAFREKAQSATTCQADIGIVGAEPDTDT